MKPYISLFNEKKKKTSKKEKEKSFKIGDKVIQNSSGIEGTVIDKSKGYVPIKWDGGSQTTQHSDSITKIDKKEK
jgi:preprotein translocase subunit YajC